MFVYPNKPGWEQGTWEQGSSRCFFKAGSLEQCEGLHEDSEPNPKSNPSYDEWTTYKLDIAPVCPEGNSLVAVFIFYKIKKRGPNSIDKEYKLSR